ncbi:MAG: phosphatase PAP2 family protein, partial [Gammaproteobacteria bacterium]
MCRAVSALLGAAVFAAAALLVEHSGLDLWTLDAFYDPAVGCFPARRAWWARTLLHDGQAHAILLIAFAALAIFVASLLVVRLRTLRRAALYLLACMALTTATVGALKQQSGRDCPWDLERYGGTPSAVVARGGCFPGGHSSGAFSLFALVVLIGPYGRRRVRAVFAGVLGLGLGYAATQWLRGAHFPSHDLWSACIGWSWAHAPLLGRAPRPAPAPAMPAARAAAAFALVAVLSVLAAAPRHAAAAEPPRVRDIAFRGNDVTQPRVMLREISIGVGDVADPAAIERSRQAILDLGLFRGVDALQEPLADGVRVVFVVKEKWYLLPYPRLSANSDGQDALGAELRWNNVGGLNHGLRALVSSADRAEEGRGRQLGYLASYHAPFVLDTPYTLDLKGSHTTTPIEPLDAALSGYDETVDELQALLGRKLGDGGAASQGWSAGGGLLWRRQRTDGAGAPPPWGDV